MHSPRQGHEVDALEDRAAIRRDVALRKETSGAQTGTNMKSCAWEGGTPYSSAGLRLTAWGAALLEGTWISSGGRSRLKRIQLCA